MRKSAFVLLLSVAVVCVAPLAMAQDQVKGKLDLRLSSPEHGSGHVMEMDRESHRLLMNLTVGVQASNFHCATEKELTVEVKLPEGVPMWAGASLNPDSAKILIPAGKPGINTPESFSAGTKILLELNWNAESAPENNHVDYDLTTKTTVFDTNGCVPIEIVPTEATYRASAHMLPPKATTDGGQCEGELATLVEECQEPMTSSEDGGGNAPSVNAALAAMMAGVAVALLRRNRA